MPSFEACSTNGLMAKSPSARRRAFWFNEQPLPPAERMETNGTGEHAAGDDSDDDPSPREHQKLAGRRGSTTLRQRVTIAAHSVRDPRVPRLSAGGSRRAFRASAGLS